MNTYFTFNQRHEFPTTSGIYVIKNILNNKVIVGQTILPFRQRWKVHIRSLRNNNHENSHLQNAFGKYGERAFVFQILEETANDLNEKEIAWIEKLNSKNRDIGYNIRDGGSHGKMSMESRRKLSLSNKGRKHTEKTKLKISKSHMGIQTCLGHKLTSAHKKKISESRRGKKNSVEVRMKLSNNAKERYKNKENH